MCGASVQMPVNKHLCKCKSVCVLCLCALAECCETDKKTEQCENGAFQILLITGYHQPPATHHSVPNRQH